MQIIGITGGIGSGKSMVLSYLKDCGAYIVEADKLAHHLMEPDMPAYLRIVECFGDTILNDDRTINRNVLGSIVFSDEAKLKQLNEIVHPAVKKYIIDDIKRVRSDGKIDYYVIEAALLIQDGYREICDTIWFIYTDEQTRIKRLVAGRGKTAKDYEAVIKNQDDEDFYRANCDVVIDNSNDFESTQNVINDLLNK
jgi:dephospho-CoA kinase